MGNNRDCHRRQDRRVSGRRARRGPHISTRFSAKHCRLLAFIRNKMNNGDTVITRIVSAVFTSLIFATGTTAVQAEDIDIFSQNPTVASQAPNVLFIMDNTSNWNQQFDYEMAALQSVFANL